MGIRFNSLIIVLISVTGFIVANVASAAGFYSPVCETQENGKKNSLKKLNQCLVRAGRPPVKEEEFKKSSTICSKEMKDYEADVRSYLHCLEPEKVSPSP